MPADCSKVGSRVSEVKLPGTKSGLRQGEVHDLLSAAHLEYFERLSHFIDRQINDGESARELAHEVFVELWRALPELDLSKPLLPWLLVVARRRALDEHRRRESRARLLANLAPLVKTVQQEVSPGVFGLLDSLETLDRLIVYRRVFRKDSFADIAVDLDISCGACRMRYSRAVTSLRSSEND
jgi:RNA polymerase sigma factor (sigma-70 family)